MIKITKRRAKKIIFVFLLLAFIVGIYSIHSHIGGIFSSQESLQNFIRSFGPMGSIILVLIISLEVIIAPIPGFIPALTAGFLFGPFWGAFYIYLGNVIGTTVLFLLIRKYGRLIAFKLFNKNKVDKYERLINRNENWLLVFYFIPIFPVDIATAAFGLSAISPRKFISTIIFGYLIYALTLAFFGDVLANFYFNYFN